MPTWACGTENREPAADAMPVCQAQKHAKLQTCIERDKGVIKPTDTPDRDKLHIGKAGYSGKKK